MSDFNHQAERQILAYESRLQHIDELLERMDRLAIRPADIEQANAARNELAGRLSGVKGKSAGELSEEELAKAGPMGVWDAVAQQLEKLVEKAGV